MKQFLQMFVMQFRAKGSAVGHCCKPSAFRALVFWCRSLPGRIPARHEIKSAGLNECILHFVPVFGVVDAIHRDAVSAGMKGPLGSFRSQTILVYGVQNIFGTKFCQNHRDTTIVDSLKFPLTSDDTLNNFTVHIR